MSPRAWGVAPTHTEVAARIAAVAAGQTWRLILVLALAGADVPTRPEPAQGRRRGRKKPRAKRARWTGASRETKRVRFYLIDEARIAHGLSWHQVQTDEEVAAALRQVKALA